MLRAKGVAGSRGRAHVGVRPDVTVPFKVRRILLVVEVLVVEAPPLSCLTLTARDEDLAEVFVCDLRCRSARRALVGVAGWVERRHLLGNRRGADQVVGRRRVRLVNKESIVGLFQKAVGLVDVSPERRNRSALVTADGVAQVVHPR